MTHHGPPGQIDGLGTPMTFAPDNYYGNPPLTTTQDDATHLDSEWYIASSYDTLHHVVLTTSLPQAKWAN